MIQEFHEQEEELHESSANRLYGCKPVTKTSVKYIIAMGFLPDAQWLGNRLVSVKKEGNFCFLVHCSIINCLVLIFKKIIRVFENFD